jgi:uncharacterized membrane protein
VVRLTTAPRIVGRSFRGVLLGVDAHRLARLAAEHGCVLRLLVPIGQYVPQGAPLVEVHGGRVPPAEDVLRALDLGRERTLYQDPAYGIRQLVDIAAQALSPAVNAPTTAVQVLDRLTDLLPGIASRPDPTGLVADERRELRLVVPVPTWSELVTLSFTEIRRFGAASPQVTRRLAAVLDELLAACPERRWPELERERELLVRAVEASVPDAEGRRVALAPDALGLG